MTTALSLLLMTLWFGAATLHSPATVDYAAQLQAAQGEAQGENGYAALFALDDITPAWPKKLPLCPNSEPSQCPAKIPENLPHYQNIAMEEKAKWQHLDDNIAQLLTYGYFRQTISVKDPYPKYQGLFRLSNLNLYRFADGDQDTALTSSCQLAHLGLKLVQSHNTYLDSMIGTTLIKTNTLNLTHMLAKLPAGHPLPKACDALQVQSAETLSLCALQYGEWRALTDSGLENGYSFDTENPTLATRLAHSLYQSWIRQLHANTAYKGTLFCEKDIIEALERDDPRIPHINNQQLVKHCAPFNVLCRMTYPDDDTHGRYQRRLLNVNRYIAALDAIRAPENPLPAYIEPAVISGKGNVLILHLHPEHKDDNATLTLSPPEKTK